MDEYMAEVWEVHEMINSRILKGVVQYRVRWAGCTEFEDTWESIEHLDNCPDKRKRSVRSSLETHETKTRSDYGLRQAFANRNY